jgi:sodium transport system permease protein
MDDREPDWRLVLRKELGDLVGRVGRATISRTLVVVVIFGLLVPISFADTANLPAFFAIFMAFLPARLVAVDALAGERERGTLEVLLASPLSDRGIAVGKIAAATVYGAVRGWLFLVTWAFSAALLRLTGLAPDAPVPSPVVALAVAATAVLVAYAAAVFGIWQSAVAPSVRAIVERGGLLRLLLILFVFFVAPWLLGLLSPDGQAPALPVPGADGSVSLAPLMEPLTADPARTAIAVAILLAAAAVALWWLTRDTLRRCRRERLALVA